MEIKYIVALVDRLTHPVIFSELDTHVDVARKLRFDEILGAGFCSIDDNGRWKCYGKSVGLDVISRGKEDERVLNRMLGPDRHGF